MRFRGAAPDPAPMQRAPEGHSPSGLPFSPAGGTEALGTAEAASAAAGSPPKAGRAARQSGADDGGSIVWIWLGVGSGTGG